MVTIGAIAWRGYLHAQVARGNKSLHFGELLSILRLPQLPKYLQPFLAFIELNHS